MLRGSPALQGLIINNVFLSILSFNGGITLILYSAGNFLIELDENDMASA